MSLSNQYGCGCSCSKRKFVKFFSEYIFSDCFVSISFSLCLTNISTILNTYCSDLFHQIGFISSKEIPSNIAPSKVKQLIMYSKSEEFILFPLIPKSYFVAVVLFNKHGLISNQLKIRLGKWSDGKGVTQQLL